MVVPENDILKLSKEDVDPWILLAREDNRINRVHYYGEGAAAHLRQIDGIEGDSEYEIRKRYALSNEWICEGLFRPFDNIFSAKGRTIDIDIPAESVKRIFIKQLQDVKNGLSLHDYLKTIWKDNFIVDPSGLIFLEVKRNELKGYLTQKSINVIQKMMLHGTRPEYVMFEADVTITDERPKEQKEGQDLSYSLHWFVDDIAYYRLKVWADKEKQSEIIETRVNNFGYVPARVNSTIIDTNRGIKVSPFHKQIGLLDKYLRNGSVHELFIAKHGYPVFWAYGNVTKACETCGGSGIIDEQTGATCGHCKGQGWKYKKDVSDMILLNPPTHKDSPTIAPNVAGYNGPDRAVSEDQRVEETWTRNNINYSLWGTTEERGKNETATGRFIDSQPVTNKLNYFADITDSVGTDVIIMFADLYVPLSFRSGTYSGGRRFMIETPDQIWQKYLNAKKEGSSELTLNQLLAQYYETEYQTNDILREYYLKVMKIDSLPHNNIIEVLGMDIGEDFKEKKLYLYDFLNTKTMMEIIDLELEVIKDDLVEYIDNKKVVNQT